MYVAVVFGHSVLRWAALLLGAVAVWRAVTGQSRGRAWSSADSAACLAFMIVLDLQLLVGLVLYVKSPITILGLHELDLAARSSSLRFFTFIHPVIMLASVVCAHIAQRRIHSAGTDAVRFRSAALFHGLALALAIAGTPWPFLSYGRPLLERRA